MLFRENLLRFHELSFARFKRLLWGSIIQPALRRPANGKLRAPLPSALLLA